MNIDDHRTSNDNHRWPQNYRTCREEPRGRSSDFPICPLVPLSCSRCRRRSLSTVRVIDIDLFKLYARIDRSYKHRHVKLINDRLTRLHPFSSIVSVDLWFLVALEWFICHAHVGESHIDDKCHIFLVWKYIDVLPLTDFLSTFWSF